MWIGKSCLGKKPKTLNYIPGQSCLVNNTIYPNIQVFHIEKVKIPGMLRIPGETKNMFFNLVEKKVRPFNKQLCSATLL